MNQIEPVKSEPTATPTAESKPSIAANSAPASAKEPAAVINATPAPASHPAAATVQAAPAQESGLCEALVVDDEPANRDFLVRLLEQAKLKVWGASSAAEAQQIIATVKNLTLIVIDNKLPDMDGVELLCQLRPKFPNARIVMATMLDERSLMTKAFDNGCDVFLVKPHGFMELFRRLQMPCPPGEDNLKRMIIDQYGPRPYRG